VNVHVCYWLITVGGSEQVDSETIKGTPYNTWDRNHHQHTW